MVSQSVFLTGATGFVGSHLTKLLVECGFRVSALYRRNLPSSSVRIPCPDAIEWVSSDVAMDWINNNKPDIVVHLATDYGKGDWPSVCVDSNIYLPLRLLEAANAAGSSLFLNADSFFGKAKFNYPHMKPYTMSKSQFMAWGRDYASTHSIRFVTMRLEHVYGEFDNKDKFVPTLMRRLYVPGEIIEFTSGKQCRDFIHVSDVARAFLTVINHSQRLNQDIDELEVGNGCSMSVRSFVEQAYKLADSNAVLDFGVLPQRAGEILDSKAWNKPLLNLGWAPIVDLHQGLTQTLRSLCVEKDCFNSSSC